ncbi:MAG: putative toxin-antitoxin system toxin component, PIN family [Ignavibacteria bacterium]
MTADRAAAIPAGAAACPLRPGDAPLVVFDTNVLVSLYVFADSRYAPLRDALESDRLRAVTNAPCLGEFARVLAYPQFACEASRQAEALARYERHADRCDVAAADVPLPRCKDPDDQKFLELARDAGAAWLVTSDRALLKLARRQRLAHMFRILTPDAALAQLQEDGDPERSAARSVASAAG